MSTATGQAELWASLMQGQALLADAVSDRLEAEAGISLAWDDQALQAVATRIHYRLAEMQFDALTQFIKARPAGIVVDAAAINSGATVEQIATSLRTLISP